MMRSPPGGFLGGGNLFRSLTLSPMNAALQQAHQMARRRLETGGATTPAPKPKADLAPRDFMLPLDVDAMEVRKAIEAKLGKSTSQQAVLKRRADGRFVVLARHLLRMGDGRFDRGRQFMHGLIRQLRARRMRRK